MTPTMIFHHPYPVVPGGTSGSQVRPYQMLQAFKEIGLEVETVVGYAKQRKQSIRRIVSDIHKGRSFSFIYSESHTIPTLLSEAHHLPTHPRLDFGFFKFLKNKRIPLGLFYRDVHWRFSQFKHTPWHKRAVMIPFYYYDWWQYKRLLDHLFLPSLEMAASLPSPWPKENLSALPPGLASLATITPQHDQKPFNLLYVGGVLPPLYNLTPMFDYLRDIPEVSLTLCCRSNEWHEMKNHYNPGTNITIVHQTGNTLESLYARANLFIILWKPNPYLDFAMPVKVFEALGHALPIVTTPGTATAQFVEQQGVGWVVTSRDEFVKLLNHLEQHPETLRMMCEKVVKIRHNHTWQARAKQVTDTLSTL
jgi:glycosyltransferase involved in cell wall biosynthesis